MANILQQTLTANGSTEAITWKPLRKNTPNRATVIFYGNFDGGIIELQFSPDDGTTWIAIVDQAGNPIQATTNTIVNFELYGNGNPIAGQTNRIRATLTASTAPNLNVQINDAR
jgi:hypothetical protein